MTKMSNSDNIENLCDMIIDSEPLEIIEKYINEEDIDLNKSNEANQTPLYFSILSGRTDVVALLCTKYRNNIEADVYYETIKKCKDIFYDKDNEAYDIVFKTYSKHFNSYSSQNNNCKTNNDKVKELVKK